MLFDRVFRNTKAPGDLLLRQALHLPQGEDLPAFRREAGDERGDAAQFLSVGDNALGAGFGVWKQHAVGHLREGVEGHDPGPAQGLQNDGFGDFEHIGARIANVIDTLKGRQDGVGLLNDVVDLEARKSPARQPIAQLPFMREDMLSQPRCAFC